MANQKISQMPSLTASELAAGDLLAVVDVSDVTQASSGSNKKITVTELQSAAVSAGTANGVLYLNGSKVATSGSALTFDGTNLGLGTTIDTQRKVNILSGAGQSPLVAVGQSAYLLVDNAGSGENYFQANSANIWQGTSGSEQMRLTSTGLGIGTSSPAYKLDVRGGIIAAGNGTIVGGISYSTRPEIGAISNHPVGFITNNVTQMLLDTAGNLGLGVTPSAWVGNAKAVQIGSFAAVWTGSNGSANSGFGAYEGGLNTYNYITTGDAPTMYQQLLGAHKWYTAPSGTAGDAISFTQAMTLDASGNLGIGTTTPSQRIDAVTSGGSSYIRNHNGTIESFSGVSEAVGGAVYGTGNSYPVTFFTNGAERARIDTSGNLLVGTTSSARYGVNFRFRSVTSGNYAAQLEGVGTDGVLWVHNTGTSGTRGLITFVSTTGTTVGTITSDGASTAYNTSSDYRLKNITGPVQNSGAYIDSLNPVEGTWKADGSTFVGLIAHEVQEASRTQVATGVKDGAEMQAMDYSNSELIANLIAEVKSLRARVAALESN